MLGTPLAFTPPLLPDDVMKPGAERATAGDDDTPVPRESVSNGKDELAAAIPDAVPAVANAGPAAIPLDDDDDGCGEKLDSGTPFSFPVPEGPAELGMLEVNSTPAPVTTSSSFES